MPNFDRPNPLHAGFDEEYAATATPDALDENGAEGALKDERIVAPKRTEYAADEIGCGSKFHPEVDAGSRQAPTANATHGEDAQHLHKKRPTLFDYDKAVTPADEQRAEEELLDEVPNFHLFGQGPVE